MHGIKIPQQDQGRSQKLTVGRAQVQTGPNYEITLPHLGTRHVLG